MWWCDDHNTLARVTYSYNQKLVKNVIKVVTTKLCVVRTILFIMRKDYNTSTDNRSDPGLLKIISWIVYYVQYVFKKRFNELLKCVVTAINEK